MKFGGTTVTPGYYLQLDTLELHFINEISALPGDATDRYRWMPTTIVLLFAASMGMALLLALPFIGIFVLFQAIGRGIREWGQTTYWD